MFSFFLPTPKPTATSHFSKQFAGSSFKGHFKKNIPPKNKHIFFSEFSWPNSLGFFQQTSRLNIGLIPTLLRPLARGKKIIQAAKMTEKSLCFSTARSSSTVDSKPTNLEINPQHFGFMVENSHPAFLKGRPFQIIFLRFNSFQQKYSYQHLANLSSNLP